MTTAVPVTSRQAELAAILRPFALLAAVAFVLGFLGYVALGRPALAQPDVAAATLSEPAASPASDDWNLPKHI